MGIRSGTLAVHNIVGFGKACEISKNVMIKESNRIKDLRDKLITMIQQNIPHTNINGSLDRRLPGNLNMSFQGANNEAIISSMPDIAISSGAACTSSTMEASHVLLALGLSKEKAYSSLRFGIGRFNKSKDIEVVTNSIVHFMQKLTKMSYV